ncbi:hypothetical protein [Flavobacterium sp. J27]|uniref:hypothetical protein n=1 Tax=Flavobacterium sp. J27 TaxID=2060419 RepID=UPI00102F8578|nr:hypothetical protein [Flavobacterium sp. J27]
MSRCHLFFLSITLISYYSTLIGNAQVFEKTAEMKGDIVEFPITLINAYPFISATVNGEKGKFMFDTGFAASIFLNDNLLSLPDKKLKGNGTTGSGQSFKIYLNDSISNILFTNGLTYKNLEKISSGNFNFIQEHITPDFLGFLGYKFFKDYLFKIDYLKRKITFYKNSLERNVSKDFLADEEVLAVIDFDIRTLENIPLVKLKIHDIEVLGEFDTGQNGFLQLDNTSFNQLVSKDYLRCSGVESNGEALLTVKDIIMDGKIKMTLKGVESSPLEDTQNQKNKAGITEPNLMTIGYRFLMEYKTVWDYHNKKIYILEY